MAKASKPGLTITFGDKKKNLSVDALRSALENALVMLQDLESEFVTAGTNVRWEIAKIKMQSPCTVTFRAVVDAKNGTAISNRMTKAAIHDLRALELNGVMPKHLGESGLQAVKNLVADAKKEDSPLKVGTGKNDQFVLTDKATKKVNDIVEKARLYVDVSTIEGMLDTVSVHGGNSFFVWETLTNYKVECAITNETHFNLWKEYLGKRVALTGRVHYRNHVPKRIVVESAIVMKDQSQLPQLDKMEPIDLTGDTPSEEYIRRLRNA